MTWYSAHAHAGSSPSISPATYAMGSELKSVGGAIGSSCFEPGLKDPVCVVGVRRLPG